MRRVTTIMILLGVVAAGGILVWQWRERFFANAPPEPAAATGHWLGALNRVGWIGSPGPLSEGHRALSNDCQACHVPFRTVSDVKCLRCHARNTGLLTRLDTAFHAQTTRCLTCHTEHQGRGARISRMEHAVVAADVPCGQCHVDRHQARLAARCTDCHGVETWKVAGFRHPAPGSMACVQCHAEPPSHRMMHFQMVDQSVTGQRDATVTQCWRCHTTDHWKNIVGVSLYEHH